MDKIPSNYDAILNLSEQNYEHILKNSRSSKSMLNLLVTEIKTIKEEMNNVTTKEFKRL